MSRFHSPTPAMLNISTARQWIFVIFFLLLGMVHLGQSQKDVRVSVHQSSQQATQGTLLEEALEFVAQESSSLYWELLEHLPVEAFDRMQCSEKCQWEHLVHGVQSRGAAVDVSVMQWSVASRQMLPRLLTNAQLARMHSPSHNGDFLACPNHTLHEHMARELHIPLRVSHDPTSSSTELLFNHDHCIACNEEPTQAPPCVWYTHLDDSFPQRYKALIEYRARHTALPPLLIRPCPVASNHTSASTHSLQGYLVELQIKNMEYKATEKDSHKDQLDFSNGVNVNALKEDYPALNKQLDNFQSFLRREHTQQNDLNIWDMTNFGIQAAYSILNNHHDGTGESLSVADSLFRLRELSQNFPLQMHNLTSIQTPPQFKDKLTQQSLTSSHNSISLNGLDLDLEKLSTYTLLTLFQQELHQQSLFFSHWNLPDSLESSHFFSFYNHFLFNRPVMNADPRFNLFHTEKESTLKNVIYLNNVETDARYKRFTPNLKELLQPVYYGRLRWVRRNVFEAIFALDPFDASQAQIVQAALPLVQSGYPIRIGIVFVPSSIAVAQEDNDSAATSELVVDVMGRQEVHKPKKTVKYSDSFDLCALLYYMNRKHGSHHAMQFLSFNVLPLVKNKAFSVQKVIESNNHLKHDTTVRNNMDAVRRQFLPQAEFLKERGMSKLEDPLLVLNGKIMPVKDIRHPQQLPQYLFSHVQQDYTFVQSLISEDVLRSDTKDVQVAILDHLNAHSIYHPQIFSKHPVYLPTSQLQYRLPNDEEEEERASTHSSTQYSFHVCLNYNQRNHWPIIFSLLKHIQTDPSIYSFKFLNTQESANTTHGRRLAHVLQNQLPSLDVSAPTLLSDLHSMLESDSSEEMENQQYLTEDQASLCSEWKNHILQQQRKNQKDAPESPSSILLELNGRILFVDANFVMFQALEKHEEPFVSFTQKLVKRASDLLQKDKKQDNALLRVSQASLASFVASDVAYFHRTPPLTWDSGRIELCKSTKYVCIDSLGDSDLNYRYPSFYAQLDPLSETAAIYSQILHELHHHFKLPLQVILNPVLEYSSVPLKSWYRFNFSPKLSFDSEHTECEDGTECSQKLTSRVGNEVIFESLPSNQAQILTMNVKPPETWLLESTFALYDLDNIDLSAVKEDELVAQYRLEHIIISGSCFDDGRFEHPRGLQLYLDTPPSENHAQDTLVMSNFGYFQLKANPGIHEVYIAPGRHAQVYRIQNAAISDFYSQSQPQDGGILTDNSTSQSVRSVQVPITSYDGPFVHLHVRRQAGEENADLFDDSNSEPSSSGGSVWQSMKNKIGMRDEVVDKKPTVHIFTVASGHLYERLMRIMMLSVVRHTKRSRVKFWILGNYLSPQFKQILPQMSKDYDFDYGLVTYKWPSWLFKQTEKQRLIWAYKILFLDVLFPVEVKRIIFVDADQVCRTDMSELSEMDIKGRAVAYTPFCSDRPEMHGYAFWRGGYWKNHLRGRPYHISALYLVDLVQLRRQYAADQYRSIYDNLARDPNSLSNLDQDLPNYAQHMVPIYSLPQNWLWCETWCSQESKSRAKTIDLCNNPETKEHKTEAAKRIIPEWIEYDREINEEYMERLKGSMVEERE